MKIKKRHVQLNHIPAVLWGEASSHLFIAIHGDQSNKEDLIIETFAKEAVEKGYQVLSFDLPGLGERMEREPDQIQPYIRDLQLVMAQARKLSSQISLFANSVGAFYSLMAYQNEEIHQVLFVSPIVDMRKLIEKMMTWFEVTPEQLSAKRVIETPIKKLYWDYYQFVMTNPINQWESPTHLLYGELDNLTAVEEITAFSNEWHASLRILDACEHFFQTDEQFEALTCWLREKVEPIC